MQAGQSSVLGLKERLQCISPIHRDAPCSIEVAPEAAGVPPKVPVDLGETGPKAARAAPRKNYGKRKHHLIDQRYLWLRQWFFGMFLFRSIPLDRMEPERPRASHARQAPLPRRCPRFP